MIEFENTILVYQIANDFKLFKLNQKIYLFIDILKQLIKFGYTEIQQTEVILIYIEDNISKCKIRLFI